MRTMPNHNMFAQKKQNSFTVCLIGVEDQIDPDSIPEGDMASPLIIKNDPSILMEDRIVNTTDAVDTSIFNRII